MSPNSQSLSHQERAIDAWCPLRLRQRVKMRLSGESEGTCPAVRLQQGGRNSFGAEHLLKRGAHKIRDAANASILRHVFVAYKPEGKGRQMQIQFNPLQRRLTLGKKDLCKASTNSGQK